MVTEPILPPQSPPPGWYPTEQAGFERWWDGVSWTDAVRPIQQLLPAQQPYPATQQPYRPPTGPAAQGVGFAGGSLTDQRTSSVEITFAWIFTVVTLGYLLPWAIAATRGKSNSVAIGLLNLFLGWTFIGWLVALVMACTAHQQRMSVVQMVNVPHYYPPSNGG